MTLTAETLIISLIFLLPGFLANRLVIYYSTSPERGESALDSTLLSLGISVGVLFVQAVLASIALSILWFEFRSNFDNLRLDILAQDGVGDYFAEQPLLFAGTAGGAALLSVILAAVVGYYDLVGSLLRKRLVKLGLTDNDVWYETLEGALQEAGMRHAYAEVVLRNSRDVFSGRVFAYSLGSRHGGGRDIVLEDVVYTPAGDKSRRARVDSGPAVLAILNSNDIESVRVAFTD